MYSNTGPFYRAEKNRPFCLSVWPSADWKAISHAPVCTLNGRFLPRRRFPAAPASRGGRLGGHFQLVSGLMLLFLLWLRGLWWVSRAGRDRNGQKGHASEGEGDGAEAGSAPWGASLGHLTARPPASLRAHTAHWMVGEVNGTHRGWESRWNVCVCV